jgi:HupE / UreJ protein
VSARIVVALALLALLASWTRPAAAHKPSDSYLTLSLDEARVDGRWDIALRDLDYTVGLDADGNGDITWGEVRAKRDAIVALATSHLTLEGDGARCPLAPGDLRVAHHSDGAYAVLGFVATCPTAPRVLGVDYELFFEQDPQHRCVTRIDGGGATRTAIFSYGDRRQTFDRETEARGRQLASAIKNGIGHIASGIDHLLFLLALLLPSVLRREPDGWKPVGTFRAALVDVAKIVTSFTVAHSITLSLSALDVVRLPSRVVESGIAASVVFAALNNVIPMLGADRWAAAFVLGLLHGFGFSATLLDLGLPRHSLVLTLFGFNVGVEIGQLAVVAVFLPLAFLARGSRAYRRVALVGGSIAIALVASVWFLERALAIRIIS